MGRPSKYKRDYCNTLIAHMAKGFSFESFAGVVGVCRDTLYHWCNTYSEFSDAKKRGETASLLFWESLGIGLATGANVGNCATFIFTMKARFGWLDQPFNSQIQEVKLLYSLDAPPTHPISRVDPIQFNLGNAVGMKEESMAEPRRLGPEMKSEDDFSRSNS